MSLEALAPLARLVRALGLRRGLERAAVYAVPCALASLAAGVAVARWGDPARRAWALWMVAPALGPVLVAARGARREALSLAREVDRRLDAKAAVLTAAELALAGRGDAHPMDRRVRDDARRALAGKTPADVLPPWSRRAKALGLVAAAAMVGAVTLPVPRHAAPAPRRAVARVGDAATAEAAREAAQALEAAADRSPAEAAALRDAAEGARSLGRALEAGLARDEALARTDALEQRAAEATTWARDARRQRAMDAALAQMDDPSTRGLRDALAAGDMQALDEAVRRVADARERRSRQSAREALARAAEAARAAGSGALADALDEAGALLARRGEASELARAMAEALDAAGAGGRVAEHLARGDDAALSRALDEAMREFDRGLTPEERRRVAEAMARLASQAEGARRADFEGMARARTPEEAREAMRRTLEALRSGSLGRTRAGDAARAGREATGALARLRVGVQSGRVPGRGAGAGGSDRDEGRGPEGGATQRLAGGGFVAPVAAQRDPRAPAVAVAVERVDTTGARAAAPDEARLRAAAPEALHGLEESPVPDGYRAQVRAYFGR